MTKPERGGVLILLSLLAVRIAAMIAVPLNETTEARYGEMARKMLETGNWVTPLHDYGVPFLAKPPLWAWLSATSMGVFGVNEFAARLPALLLSILTLALVAYLAYRRHGRPGATAAALVLAGSGGFFVASGTVMTDVPLMFSTTLILASFWLAYRYQQAVWRWMFFIGCGIGLLAKGPVALVLAGLPVFFWTLFRQQWPNLWARLPWVRGSLVTLAVALPWYVLAEIRTPGFLQYFLVGENFSRFVDKGWHGDRYGFAHAWPYGMIWVFAFACFLPWSFALPAALKKARAAWRDNDGWMLFLALWAFSSLVFFTAAANIIWPYPLPALAGLALLFAEILLRAGKNPWAGAAVLTACAGLAALALLVKLPRDTDNSQKDAIALWRAQSPAADSRLLFFGYEHEFSAAFYSAGRARSSVDAAEVSLLLKNRTQDYIVAKTEAFERLPQAVKKRFEEKGRLENSRGKRLLLREIRTAR